MADTSFDIIIIGSGPGGYVTAIRAAQLGFKTAIVERDYLGGICLNWGCIPTKALLRSAEIFHYMQHAKDYGLSAEKVTFDPAAVVKRSRAVSKRLNDGVGFLMKKNKVQVIWGEAAIDAPGKITVKAGRGEAPKGALGPGSYQAKHIIIATGARPRVLPGLEPDKKLIWTYFEAMVPDKMPKSLLVIGSGAIGIEFASFYRTLGAEVTVVEVLPQILPVEDAEIAAFARKSFEKQGIKIFTGAKVTKLDKKADSVTATIDDGKGGTQTLTVDRVIAAVGVVGNIENLGLEKVGVKTERGAIVVDPLNRTSVPGIYAIGDVSGPPLLAHKAEHEGVICVEAIKGLKPHPMDKRLIPGCTYCTPQIASVGLTEQAAKDKKLDIRVGRFPFVGNGKAIALGEDQGLVKVIFDKKTGQLARRAHGRRRSHRADPGLRGRDEPRDHGRRADAHRLPASDALRDDEGGGARCLRARAEHLNGLADHRHPHPLLAARGGRPVRRGRGDARRPGRQERGDQFSWSAGGVLSRDVRFRSAAGGLRQGRHHRSDHLDAVRRGGHLLGVEVAGDRHRQIGQRPDRCHRGAIAAQLGPRHAQPARCKPHRGGRTLPDIARLQGPAHLFELAWPLPRRRRRRSRSGNGPRTGRYRSSSIRRACRSATSSRWINSSSTS